MNENGLITVKPERCVGCNACVRACPAPKANVTRMLEKGRFITTVNAKYCIACGECVRNCTHGARDYVDDTERALDAIKTARHIVIAAPSIKTVFPKTWKSILTWFKNRGCEVYDASFGADICTWAHLRAIQNKQIGKIITQPCVAIAKYIEIYQSDLVRNLSPVHSPILCNVIYIRKYLCKKEPIIVLSPCIAKKNEFDETGLVSYNVTFKKLSEYFEKHDVEIPCDFSKDYNYAFDGEQGQMGSIYPRVGGLRDNLWLHAPELNITTSEGVHKAYSELDLLAELPDDMKPDVFDVLSCEFGCNVGAGTGNTKTIFDVMRVMHEIELEAKNRRRTTGGFFRDAEDKLFKRFDEELKVNDFLRSYNPSMRDKIPNDEELEPIWEQMGKHTVEARNYNCHACGYRNCKSMAIAIFRGLNTSENCIVHAKSVLLAHHLELTKKHEQLFEITEKCKQLSDEMQKDINHITGNMTSIRDANENTAERANKVRDLLIQVVDFCESSNEKMEKENISQLTAVLKAALEAFNALYDSLSESTGETKSVDKYIVGINSLVESINDILSDIVNA